MAFHLISYCNPRVDIFMYVFILIKNSAQTLSACHQKNSKNGRQKFQGGVSLKTKYPPVTPLMF
jgi:hypothetical protein